MKVIFLTNYFNDHLKEFCDELYSIFGDSFSFYETDKNTFAYEKSRTSSPKPNYVQPYSELFYMDVINADAVIFGSAPFSIIKDRVKKDCNRTFLYQERSLKNGPELLKYPFRYFKWHKRFGRKNNCFVLCASAFTSTDYKKFGLFKGKCLRFGYFPNRCLEQISFSSKTIDAIFVARLVPLKHPEVFVELCKKIVKSYSSFSALIIGDGPMYESVNALIQKNKLQNNVKMVGYKTNQEVIDYMKKSKTFIFASDSREGWGTVVNESMSSGCIPFVRSKVGSSKFLICDGVNGYIFKSFKHLYAVYSGFLTSNNKEEISQNAKKTIDFEWNGIVAAQRFAKILINPSSIKEFKTGPLSLIK